MQKFQVELAVLFAAALAETLENTRMTGRIPALASVISNAIAGAVADDVSKQVREQSDGRINLKVLHSEIDISKMVADALVAYVRQDNKEMLEGARVAAERFQLPARWASKVNRILESLDNSDAKTLEIQVKELLIDFREQLTEPLFLCIHPARRDLFEQNTPPFGESVAEKYPDAAKDIAAATRCLALDEWTACVFHCMRVLEHGLHTFAATVGVTFPTPIGLENWKNVIDKIEAEIRMLEQAPKSAAKSITTKSYSEAAAQFRYFKDAWRNHVSHSREHYDSREAERVWSHVKDFMQTLVDLP